MTKADDVKALLMETSDRLFFENGYDAVGVADICKAAGKAKGLFFYYFEKKENVVKALTENQIRQMSAHLNETLGRMQLTAADKLQFLMNTLISKQSTGPRAMAYFKQDGIPEWFDFYAHELKDRYVFPIIRETAKAVAEGNENQRITDEAIEIIYLGISAFMHRNFQRMADEIYYRQAVSAISVTLENALSLPDGSIVIE